MNGYNSDDNLMSIENPNSWSSSINLGNHTQNPLPNPQPSFDVADHHNPDLTFQSEFSEQSHSTNEATNENAASVVTIG